MAAAVNNYQLLIRTVDEIDTSVEEETTAEVEYFVVDFIVPS